MEIPATASISPTPPLSFNLKFFHWMLAMPVDLTLMVLYLLLSDLSLICKEP